MGFCIMESVNVRFNLVTTACWVLLLQIFLFLVCLCLLCTICAGLWENSYGSKFQEILPWEVFIPGSVASGRESSKAASGATIIGILTFFSYIIILNTLVPISLYVRSVSHHSRSRRPLYLTVLADRQFSTGSYLFTVSSSGLLFSHSTVTGFPQLSLSLFSAIILTLILIYDLDLRTWPT